MPAVGDWLERDQPSWWGAFRVECLDTWAYGVGVRPARDAGWRVVSWEKGPDDD
ncbi:hypothetical protein [Nocardioides flavus (ex Wang et al. 2016)]|uniref:hypothetical protein n=1 Tax=Nocardioides flavus (ex Wang et al. 2016) TaxID=2058780 RepID=UPI00174C2022|nr:hypothetical protein [Nocardioides flavus (ex Wang et al. 2016)]